MSAVRLVMVLTENATLVDSRDLRGLVGLAQRAEDCGVDAVMISEHIVLGPSAGSAGVMENPRDYAAPGNQQPDTAWPASMVMLSAIAAVTTRLRLVAGAVISPLRHPLLLAKEWATLDLLSEGRLVVLPTVSWHREEYAALGVDFTKRGAILDEQLAVLAGCWAGQPVEHHGARFDIDPVWVSPGPYRPAGPAMWFGGQGVHPPLLRRLVAYGSGFNPFGRVTDDDLATLAAALEAAGRSGVELVGGVRATFPDGSSPADVGVSMMGAREQVARGFTTLCFKPSMFIDDVDELPDLVGRLLAGL